MCGGGLYRRSGLVGRDGIAFVEDLETPQPRHATKTKIWGVSEGDDGEGAGSGGDKAVVAVSDASFEMDEVTTAFEDRGLSYKEPTNGGADEAERQLDGRTE